MRSLRLAAAAIATTLAMAACSNDITSPTTRTGGPSLKKGGNSPETITIQGCRTGYLLADGRCVPAGGQ